MLDVHAPHENIHGLRDFFLHLFTITIGLLIALSLEGCVEWQHHRHLVHEAESSLRGEIEGNSKLLSGLRQAILSQQKELDRDLSVLTEMRAHPLTTHKTMSLSYKLKGFDDVSWKTAQTTGALAYMPYNDAREYSDIYGTQDQLYRVQEQAADAVISAASLVITEPEDKALDPEKIDRLNERIGMIQMRLGLMASLVDALDKAYQKFESEHG